MKNSSAKETGPATPGKPPVLYVVCGTDEYLVHENARKLVDKLCPPAQQAFGLEVVDGAVEAIADILARVRQCLMALQQMAFLGQRKLVWLRDAVFLDDAAQLKDELKDELARLMAELRRGAGGNQLLITAKKVDGRSTFVKACKEIGEFKAYDVPEKGWAAEKQARDALLQRLREAKLTMAEPVIEIFLERAGVDTRQIANEIEKLDVALGARREVGAEDVRLLVAPAAESLAWDLQDAMGERDLAEALKHSQRLLLQREQAVRLVMAIESRLRDLNLLRDCLDRGWARLEARGGRYAQLTWTAPPEAEEPLAALGQRDPRKLHPFRAARLAQQARMYTPAELLRGLKLALAAHEKMVTVALPDELSLELLLVRIMRR